MEIINNMMKSLFIITILGIANIPTYAETKEKAKFGIKGGINASTTSVSLFTPDYYGQYDTKNKFKIGFDAGIFVEYPLTKSLSFQPELTLSLKGMRNEKCISQKPSPTSGYDILELNAITRMTLCYIKLPLYLKFDFNLNNSGKLIAGVGPYFAYGINGKMSSEFIFSASDNHWIGGKNIFKEDDINFNESTWVSFGGGSSDVTSWIREPYWHKSIKRFDGGISGFIGYELSNNWLIVATCDFGLLNLLYTAEKWDEKLEGKMYNRTISITFGYKF